MQNYNLIQFEDIEQRFKELVFELQMEDNKKILEFQKKLKELRSKIDKEGNYNV